MATTTNYGWTTPDDTALVKDGAAAIRTLGSSVDTTTKNLNPSTTLGDIEYRSSTANTNTRLGIGSTGQVLTVAGGVPTWATSDDANAIQNAIIDAKGDLIVGTAADTPARLAVGTNGYILTADSAEATGIKWAAAGGGGKVLQVVSATNSTVQAITSSSFVASNLTASITPSSATSKILVLVSEPAHITKAGNAAEGQSRLMRDATTIKTTFAFPDIEATGATYVAMSTSNGQMFLDSPATTSSVTYKMEYKNVTASTTIYLGITNGDKTIILMEIGA